MSTYDPDIVDHSNSHRLVPYMPCKFALVGCAEIQRGSYLVLRAGLILVPGISQRLGPFQMQAAPFGRVFFGFGELRERQIGTVPRHQGFAPQFEGIAEVTI